jgi:hypothetical protein
MPSSQVHTFTDPGEYAAAIRATTIDLAVMGRGHFIGQRTRIDLHRLWMQRLSENMPRTYPSDEIVAEHSRRFGRGQTAYDPWHYLPILARKPGALRNGDPGRKLRCLGRGRDPVRLRSTM